tara:strand:- start:48 stop:290 length:243 start_codon:yes stop_codon:yes gene_type:complete
MNKHVFKVSLGDDTCREGINTLEVSGTFEYAVQYISGYMQALKDLGHVLGPHNNVIPVDDVSMIHIDYVDPFKGWRSITA